MKIIKEKNLILLSTAQFISLFGDRLNNMALVGILGSYYSQSTFVFSGLAIFIALPSILFSPISGIIADKINRKKIMITIEILRALIVFLIPFIFIKFKNIILIYFLIFLLYSLTLPFNNAKMASIPQMVNNIYTANAFLNITGRLSIALGILFGGVIVDLYIWKKLGFEGWQIAFYIDSLTYLISAFIIAFITFEEQKKNNFEFQEIIEEEKSFLKKIIDDFKFGLEYISKDKFLLFVFKCIILTMLIISISYNVYLPYFQQNLGFGTKGIGIVGGFLGIGFIIGSSLFPIIAKKLGEIKIIIISHIIFPILFVLSLFVSNFFVLMLLFLIGGFTLSNLLISYDTFIQAVSDDSIRGRLFSFKEFLWSFSFLCFVFLIGIFGEILKIFFKFENVIKSLILITSAIVISLNLIFFNNLKTNKK
jgi:DHA3 family macrolide efflux protein-like MFS transporter